MLRLSDVGPRKTVTEPASAVRSCLVVSPGGCFITEPWSKYRRVQYPQNTDTRSRGLTRHAARSGSDGDDLIIERANWTVDELEAVRVRIGRRMRPGIYDRFRVNNWWWFGSMIRSMFVSAVRPSVHSAGTVRTFVEFCSPSFRSGPRLTRDQVLCSCCKSAPGMVLLTFARIGVTLLGNKSTR